MKKFALASIMLAALAFVASESQAKATVNQEQHQLKAQYTDVVKSFGHEVSIKLEPVPAMVYDVAVSFQSPVTGDAPRSSFVVKEVNTCSVYYRCNSPPPY